MDKGIVLEDWRHGGFGLYLHWPFCESKCPYCDFNSHVATKIDQGRWRAAYLTEITRAAQETKGRILRSVFFGGGTPSLMAPDTVAAIIECIRASWPMTNDCEITLEANPGSIESARFRDFRQAGVNRVSMGMQAMNDTDLRRLGRLHTAKEAQTAFGIARDCFERVSFDLIYARQDQSLLDWKRELGSALELAIDHLSLYQLTIEDGTVFAARAAKGGLHGLPNEDLAADMYEVTQELCEKAGMPAYEVSNHAKPGAESQHNLVYWRGGDYIGVGPGAHGRLTLDGARWATEAPKTPGQWLSLVEAGLTAELPRNALTPDEHRLEYLLMSLRLTEGLNIRRYEGISHRPLSSKRLTQLDELGMIKIEAGQLIATPKGRMVLNAILRDLAAD